MTFKCKSVQEVMGYLAKYFVEIDADRKQPHTYTQIH